MITEPETLGVHDSLPNRRQDRERRIAAVRFLFPFLAAICLVVLGAAAAFFGFSSRATLFTSSERRESDDSLDARLQQAATTALGERGGTVIIMDPQTGRVRALVNPKIALEDAFRPG